MRRHRMLGVATALLALGATAGCGGGSTSTEGVSENCTPAHSFETVQEGVLTVSVYVSPPYTMKDGNTYKGVDTDLIRKIAAMECLQPQFKEIAAAGLIQSVQSQRSDTALGGIYRTPERAKTLELSATAYTDGMVLVAKEKLSTLEQLEGKTLGVIQGYLWTADLQKALGKDSVKIYQSSEGMINDLQNGRVDVVVLTNAEAAYRIEQVPEAGLVATEMEATPEVAASQHPGEVVFPSPKGKTAQAKAISEDIRKLVENGTVAKVLKKYGMPESAAPDS